jgi:hypothetical protein
MRWFIAWYGCSGAHRVGGTVGEIAAIFYYFLCLKQKKYSCFKICFFFKKKGQPKIKIG